MAGVIVVLIICAILYKLSTDSTNQKLVEENRKLREELKKYQASEAKLKTENISAEEKRVDAISDVKIVEDVQKEVQHEQPKVYNQNISNAYYVPRESTVSEEEKRKKILEKQISDMEKKNTSILVTGAVLIVLAAIVFLMSTWNAIPNIIKTVVLGLFIAVFLGLSKVAETKFKLKKATLTFFYIGMAYIPVFLLSLSVLGLLGDYLSINGEGVYIYLTIAMFITSAIYLFNYERKDDKVLLYGSILSQVSTIVLFTLIFESSIRLIILGLLLYNIVLYIANQKLGKHLFIEYINLGIVYFSSVVSIFYIASDKLIQSAVLGLVTFNHFLLLDNKVTKEYAGYFFNGFLFITGLHFIGIFKSTLNEFRLALDLAYIIAVFIIERNYFKDSESKELKLSLNVMTFLAIFGLYFMSLEEHVKIFKSFVFLIAEEVFLIYIQKDAENEFKKFLNYAIPVIYVGIIFSIAFEFDLSYKFQLIVAGLSFIANEFLMYNYSKDLYKTFLCVIALYFGTISCVYVPYKIDSRLSFMWAFATLIMYSYIFLNNEKLKLFKYLTYVVAIVFGTEFMKTLNIHNTDTIYIITAIVSMVSMFLENNKKVKDEFSEIFIILSEVYTLFALALMKTESVQLVITSIYSIMMYISIVLFKQNEYIKILPAVGLLLVIHNSDLSDTFNIIITSLIAISTGYIASQNKKFNVDTAISGVYLYVACSIMDVNYLRFLLVLIWAIVGTLGYEDKIRKAFKVIAYVSIFGIYSSILVDLLEIEFKSFKLLGFIVLEIAILKTVLSNKKENDSIEMMVYGLTFLFSLTQYVNEFDGLIYVFGLIAFVIYGYYKKYGNLVIVSLLAIIVNFILLIREFLSSVPWYIYLLLIGSGLITFALKNESRENKLNIGKMYQTIKDKIEK